MPNQTEDREPVAVETVAQRRGRSPRKRSWSSFAGGALFGALGVLLLTLVVGMPLAVGHRNDLPLERLYGDFAVSLAARTQAGSVPPAPASNPRDLAEGQASYLTCAECHGATGKGNGVYGQGTYPNATDLTSRDAKEKSDAELFWYTKNGISFAGMPAFDKQFKDAEIWQIVAYMRALQNGQAPAALAIPTASAQQLAYVNPGGDPTQQGAAVYFVQGCQNCHGAVGNAPRNLAIRDTNEAAQVIRNGKQGMPHYGPDQITDADLKKVIAYLNTFNNNNRGRTG